MSRDPGEIKFSEGDTAEDFANLVADILPEGRAGIVRIPFEDFTIPDRLVFLETTQVGDIEITYFQLFAGALEHFHGLKATAFRAVPNSDVPQMTPFCMSLEVVVEP